MSRDPIEGNGDPSDGFRPAGDLAGASPVERVVFGFATQLVGAYGIPRRESTSLAAWRRDPLWGQEALDHGQSRRKPFPWPACMAQHQRW